MALNVIHNKKLDDTIKDCITGNSEAQQQLYNLYSASMLSVCLRFLKSRMDAEDALHEGFIRVFKKIHTYSGKGSFEGWMKSLFVNVSLRMLENQKKLRINEEEPEAKQHAISNGIIEQLHYEELIQLVNELPDGYRVIFIMYAIEGFSHKEIANHLNISESTSKSQLSRARNALRLKVKHFCKEISLSK